METVFLRLLNMSLTAGVLVVAVLLLRLVFHKAPRWIHCLLWALVAVRLLCPFTIESNLSLMPDTPAVSAPAPETSVTPPVENAVPDTPTVDHVQTVPPTTDDPVELPPVVDTPPMTVIPPELNVPLVTPDSSIVTATPEASVDPWQVALTVATWTWLAGVVLLAAYAVFTTLRLRRQVGEAAHIADNLWQCDHLRSPFILGLFRPRIYLPSDLDGAARDSVVAHEQAHIHRRDHWWKPLGFVLLTVYWFNPLMWVAYIFLCRDIEAACDERVVRGMSAADRRSYSEALLSCSAPRRLVTACPLAFGETAVKSRIKSVLSYKKPTIWIIVAALLVSTVAGVCLLTDRPDGSDKDPKSQTSTSDEEEDPADTTPRYASFTHTEQPYAQVTLEIGGNSCTYASSILSSWVAVGTYTMGDHRVLLDFPDDAMTIEFEGDLTGLTLRIGQSDTMMSYEQMSFGDYTLKNGAVFKRDEEPRTVSFETPHTFSAMNWMAEEKRTALRNRYSYRTGSLSDKDRPIIPITSRAELDAFLAEYQDDVSWWPEKDTFAPLAAYDDVFFADTMLAVVYYNDGTYSVKPQIAAVEYNGAELVTLQVDIYEPTMQDGALGQWFMLAEIPRSEIGDATAFRAVERHRIPTDYYFATYSHPIEVGDTEPSVGWMRLEYPMAEFQTLVDSVKWYGADIMADTAFEALGYFSFDGEKKYYVSPDGKRLYDGEQIADLSDDDAEWVSYPFHEGVVMDAATTSVTGMVVEWSKEGGYLVLEVTDGDAKLGDRVRAYTAILWPGSAPAVGYAATVYYDGWYLSEGDYSVIYALDRKWMDADLLGGPDDDDSTTGTTTKPTTGSTTGITGTTKPTTPTTKPTTPTTPELPTTAPVGLTYADRSDIGSGEEAEEIFGSSRVKRFDSRAEFETFLTTYQKTERNHNRWEISDFDQFDETFFTENVLLMTRYTLGSGSITPYVAEYTYSEDRTILSVGVDELHPSFGTDDMAFWLLFSGIKKVDLQGVTELKSYLRKEIPTDSYIAAFTELTTRPETGVEKWRTWFPHVSGHSYGWYWGMMLTRMDEAGRWVSASSMGGTYQYMGVFQENGHLHYVSSDYTVLLRDDGKMIRLNQNEINLLQCMYILRAEGDPNTYFIQSTHPGMDPEYLSTPRVINSPELRAIAERQSWLKNTSTHTFEAIFIVDGKIYYVDWDKEQILYYQEDVGNKVLFLTKEEKEYLATLICDPTLTCSTQIKGTVVSCAPQLDYLIMRTEAGKEIQVSLLYWEDKAFDIGTQITVGYDGYTKEGTYPTIYARSIVKKTWASP